MFAASSQLQNLLHTDFGVLTQKLKKHDWLTSYFYSEVFTYKHIQQVQHQEAGGELYKS